MEGDVRGAYGVHAFTTRELAIEYGTDHRLFSYVWWSNPEKSELALGQVSLWGEVVEHQRGYRASFAKVIALDSFIQPSSIPISIEQLRLKYKV